MSEPEQLRPARILAVMGVSSSGKTSVGRLLADEIGAAFLEGDDYHPESNVEKMHAGHPLTDEDRWPWLAALSDALREGAAADGKAVAACSALKRSYRDFMIEKAGEPILFVYLKGAKPLIAERIRQRKGHFMPASLLDSQFATLEEPEPDENVLTVGIEPPVEEIVAEILRRLPGTAP